MDSEENKAFWYDGQDLEILAEMPHYHKWIMDFFVPHLHGDILEIGSGTGALSQYLLPLADHLDLVEPSPNLVPHLEDRLGRHTKIRIHTCTLENFLEDAQKNTFDAIVMVNVLEHIRDDSAAVSGLLSLLRKGGHLLLFVPALPFLYSRLDRLIGHYRRYERPAMRTLLEQAGFEVVKCCWMDFLGIIPWWVNFTLAGQTTFNANAAHLYDRFGVPLTRTIERISRIPIGKNIVAIGRKPIN